MSCNVLVTGANGQLGSEMRLLGEAAAGVGATGNNYIFTDVAELDITDREAVRRMVTEEGMDVIVNCAAYTNVDGAEDDPLAADLLNNRAPAILAGVAKEVGATLIHISTDYVFGGDGNLPCAEADPVNPTGVYGRTKLAGEEAVAASGCEYIIFRTAWLYSPFGRNFVKTMIALTSERDSLKVVFDQVGTPTYAADLARVIFDVIESGKYKGNSGIYHYSNEGVCSWYDFAREIASAAGNKCDIQPCYSWEFPSKVKRPVFSVLDKSNVKRTFGTSIPYWRESLLKCIDRIMADKN